MDTPHARSPLGRARRRSRWARAFVATSLLVLALSISGSRAPLYAQDDGPLYLPLIRAPASHIVIAAAHVDSVVTGEPDEAILLWNTGSRSQSLAGWELSTASRHATFPITATLTLEPGQRLWCAAQDAAFLSSFGEPAACAWGVAAQPATARLEGSLALNNLGGYIALRDAGGVLVDTLLYGDASQPVEGWSGAPAQLYSRGSIGVEGQLFQRKLHPVTGQPQDTDAALDWAGDLADVAWGRRVRRPGWQGWDDAGLARPLHGDAFASVTVAVAPEGLYAPLAAALASANHSIDLSLYVFEHPEVAKILAAAAGRGVRVRLLLEGGPPGGVSDLQRWCVRHLVAAGADVRYLAPAAGAPPGYDARYRYTHAKFGIIDGNKAFVGSENFSWDAMPVDVSTPVGGRRGFYLLTDAAPVVHALAAIFNQDWAPERFLDLEPYSPAHPKYGDPPADFVLPLPPVYEVEAAPFAQPVTAQGQARFIVASAPENALRPDDGLHALLQRAGPGDEILLAQLYEHKYWGDGDSNPIADPNPRLQLMIDAARRGARVRLLLDSFFDDPEDPRSNRATTDYVRAIAAAEGLDLDARLGNPTGGGIHAKLLLVRVDGETWSAVGSLNGGEVSHKLNREVVLLVDAPAVYARLAEVFAWDWQRVGP